MKLRNLYLLNTVAALLFAIGLLLMTPIMLGMFGMDDTRDARTLAQFVAVELTSTGLLTLFALGVTDMKARSAVNNANLAATALGFFVSLNAVLSGAMNSTGWLVVALYFVLAAGFAYFQFFGPAE